MKQSALSSRASFAALFIASSILGCGAPADTPDPDSGTTTPTPDSGTSSTTDAGTSPTTDSGTSPTDSGTEPAEAWALRSHPCPGINRTDALMVDDDGSVWIGCGSGTEGRGLYVSEDGGETWAIPATNPSGLLEAFRVLSIHRGYGGLVYVAGEGPASTMAISLDTSSSPYAAEAVLTRGTTVGRSFLTSPFVTTSSGQAFADSFVGHDALFRPDPSIDDKAASWTDANEWEDDGGTSHQILDMVATDDGFVACGSTIAEPPYVFLPSRTSSEPYAMTPVQLVSGLGTFSGEMWGVAASSDRVVVTGVNHTAHIGKIFVSGADRYEAGDYTQHDIEPLLPTRVSGSDNTWGRGVCMRGDRVVVVGEIQPLGAGDNSGFVLESLDGGATFTDITPDGSPDTWSKCQIEPSGRLVVAGAGMVGFMN